MSRQIRPDLRLRRSAARNIESGTVIDLSLRPGAAVVAMAGAGHIGQAGAFEFLDTVQALDDTEKSAGLLHVEPGAVVAHVADGSRTLPRKTANLDRLSRPLLGEFQGMGNQMEQDDASQGLIAADFRKLDNRPFDSPGLSFRCEILDDLPDLGSR